MARLPNPGGDEDTWGDILNEYLQTSHKANGTLKDNVVTSAQLADNAVTAAQIADGSITETQLHTDVRAKLNEAAPVTSVSSKTGDVTLAKTDVGLSNVDNTSDASKPVSDATQAALDDLSASMPAVNIAGFGASPGAPAATNDAAFSAALATGRPVYVPGYGFGSPYNISVPIDMTAGSLSLIGDAGSTNIVQATDSAAIIQIGGGQVVLQGLRLRHSGSAPSATTGNGIETYSLTHSRITDVTIECSATCLRSVSGYFFSNLLENLEMLRFYQHGIRIDQTGNTGSCWNNIYVSNKGWGASPLVSQGVIVHLQYLQDSVFNQLNIEHCTTSGYALFINGTSNITFNGLHIEGVNITGWSGAYIQAYGNTKAMINGLQVGFCDIAPTGGSAGGRKLINADGGGQVIVNNIFCQQNTNGSAQEAKIANANTGSGAVVWVNGGITKDIFTAASTGALAYSTAAYT